MTLQVEFRGRKVDVDGSLEVGEGFYVTSAYWSDEIDGEGLDHNEMLALEQECASKLYDGAYENMAYHAYDMAKDFRKYRGA